MDALNAGTLKSIHSGSRKVNYHAGVYKVCVT